MLVFTTKSLDKHVLSPTCELHAFEVANVWSSDASSSGRKCSRSFTYFSQRENIQGIGIDMLISNYLMYKFWFSFRTHKLIKSIMKLYVSAVWCCQIKQTLYNNC